MTKEPTRNAIAMHEAGHAVIRLTDPGAPVVAGISLHPANGAHGHVDTQPMWHPAHTDRPAPDPTTAEEWRRFAGHDLAFFLAGPIAEMRWRRLPRIVIQLGASEMAERCLGPVAPDFGSDLDQVKRRLRWSSTGAESAAFEAAWLATEGTVARWMPAIRKLAILLAEAGELDEDDIEVFRRRHLQIAT